ncbi:diguanylate cyclase [Labrys miyagiensis]|uniref:Diguanylate cyclase n=1 Tax=Labrys miyagiensis TaxID=346912 RepID=A0ABQ6CVZ1_9HYPH|nr:diguanylate cyclase [Labrys miyagiensis]
MRKGLWLAVLAYLLFSITDIILIPDVSVSTIAARSSISVLSLAILEIFILKEGSKDVLEMVCALAVVLGYAGWLLVAIKTEHVQNFSHYMVFGALFMMGANLFFAFRFSISVVSSILILLFFFVSLGSFPADLPYKICIGTFFMSCFVFTAYINWNLNLERFNVFLNALEAKRQQKEAAERGQALLRLSRTDPLTNLNNRRAIDEILRHYHDDWRYFGTNFGILLIDVDFFKKFNDYHGHPQGDHCLSLVAKALGSITKSYGGSIGRYGGEEFIALVRADCKEQLIAFAEAVRRTVEELALPHRGRRDRSSIVTASIGASITREGTDAKLERMISEADRALYLAKANGRNCVRLFEPNDPGGSDLNDRIAGALKDAINRDLVSLAYQPIKHIESGRIDTVEALMRLHTSDGMEISPYFFIPIAEKYGTILDLQLWMIRTVCTEILAECDVLNVSVNISPIELKTADFAASVAAILEETGAPGDRLIFEITERLEIELESEILTCIRALKLLGIRIWLDDFGTGFAGLSWLRLIDFDTVKIDRSFLADCATSEGRILLCDIANLVRNRGPNILVEGVESNEQLVLLRELGIDQAQGFHIGMPSPAERLLRGGAILATARETV